MALILVVDDSLTTRVHLSRILEGAGYEILVAEDVNAGLVLLEDNKPDCIISDLLMPGVNGIEFLKIIKSSRPEIPVIISTADVQNATRDECLALGAVALVNKPARKEAICEAIELALAGGE